LERSSAPLHRDHGRSRPRRRRAIPHAPRTADDRLDTATVRLALLRPDAVEVGQPVERLTLSGEPDGILGSYDLLPDGSGAIAVRTVQGDRDVAALRRVRLTLNWFERLRELTAVRKP